MAVIIGFPRIGTAWREVQKMRVLKIVALSAVLVGSAVPPAWAAGSSALFDKPLREVHTPLPRDKDNPQSKPMLSCFYYSHFMVKQIDLGELGAEQLSFLHVSKDRDPPPCIRANAKDEMVVDPKQWGGYFKGVKGSFVFFDADDGDDGGMGFAVFGGLDGVKIFDDVAKKDISALASIAPVAQSNKQANLDTAVQLHYRRVYQAPCSLRADEKNCWNTIQQITGLTETAPPNCAATYGAEEKRLPARAKESAANPSVITYDVEVVLDSRDTTVRVTPISKAIECYPAD